MTSSVLQTVSRAQGRAWGPRRESIEREMTFHAGKRVNPRRIDPLARRFGQWSVPSAQNDAPEHILRPPLSQRFRPFAQNIEIPRVAEHTIPFLARELASDPEISEEKQRVGNGGKGKPGAAAVDAVFLEEGDESPGCQDRAFRGLAHAFEEEVEPGLPISVLSHLIEQPVVFIPVLCFHGLTAALLAGRRRSRPYGRTAVH